MHSSASTAESPLFGRRTDLERLERLLMPSGALVTVVGPPGVGKTRLCSEILARSSCADRFCVLLSDVTDERGLVDALARATHTQLAADRGDAIAQVGLALSEMGEVLVLLDNVEQLLSTTSRAVSTLRASAPLARFLLTSRQRLHVTNEWVLDLDPLSVPGEEDDPLHSDAVLMLLDRVGRARGRDVDPADLPLLAEIARRLEGIPLALELFSPRIATLGAHVVALRLRGEGAIHSTGAPSASGPQRTLHDAIRTSWELLSGREREALCQLAVFSGGFTVDAALAVLSDAPDGAALDLLHGLRERSLLVVLAERPLRLSMFESIRAFARTMSATPMVDAELRRARHFAEELGHAVAQPSGAPTRALLAERQNLRAVVAWASASREPQVHALGARVLLGLQLFVDRAPLEPYLDDLEAFSAAARSTLEPTLAVGLLCAIARCKRRLGRMEEALAHQDQALVLAQTHGVNAWRGRVLSERGMIHFVRGDFVAALSDWDASTTIFEQQREDARVAVDQLRSAMALREKGDLASAVERAERAYVGARRLHQGELGALAVAELAQLRLELGDEARASTLVDEAEHAEERSLLADVAIVARRGFIDLSRDKLEVAKQRLQRALFLLSRIGYRRFEGGVLGYLGVIELESGRYLQSRALLEQACELLIDYPGARGLFASWWARLELDAGNAERARLLAADVPALAANIPLSVASHVLLHGHDAALREALTAAPLPGAKTSAYCGSLDVRLAARHFTRTAPVAATTSSSDLILQADGSAFEIAHQIFSIKKHMAMRRILVRLVERHLASPGTTLDVETLAAAGWPGERIRDDAARNRVKVAVAGLRKHGLRDILVHHGTGYSLRLDLTVEVRASLPDPG